MKYLKMLCIVVLVPVFVAFAPHEGDEAWDGVNNASPPGIGANLPIRSRNIEVLANLTIADMGAEGANVFGNDCWGWTDSTTGKEYALVGLRHRTTFVDISDPTNPQYLGFLPTENGLSVWRDMKVYNDHIFVVADGSSGHGMQVFDLTNLRTADPQDPQEYSPAAYYGDSGPAHNIAINEDTGYAYILGSNVANGGIHAVNIQNPLNPVFAGEFASDGYTHDAVIVSYNGPDPDYSGQEIAFACHPNSGNDRLTIVNVTDKSNMTMVSSTEYPLGRYSHQCWMTDDHRYIYLGDELDEDPDLPAIDTRMHVFDCLDLDNPQYLGFHSGATGAIDHNLLILGNKIFSANNGAGMRVLEIDPADPVNLTEIGFVDTFPSDDLPLFTGAWACWPYFESGNVIINDRQGGLFIVRLMELEFLFPDGRPVFVSNAGETEFMVEVVEGIDGTPAPGTAMLHVDRGNGFETFTLDQVSDNLYEVTFPEMDCNTDVRYYFSATQIPSRP